MTAEQLSSASAAPGRPGIGAARIGISGWRYVPALTKYALEMTDAWIARGHGDTVRPQVLLFAPEVDALRQDELDLPPWIGDEDFHLSHRSNLIRKDPEFYGEVFPDVPDDLPYVWPGETIRHDG